MGKGKRYIKNNTSSDYISQLEEWQEHQYVPGYHMGSGRMRSPLKIYARFPIVFIVLGVMGLVLGTIVFIKSNKNLSSIFSVVIQYIFAILFIYGGIARIKESKRKAN